MIPNHPPFLHMTTDAFDWLQINLHWLHRWCVRVIGPDTANEIADSICNVILLDKSPDEAAADLIELLGYSAFDEVTALMGQRYNQHVIADG